VTEAQCPDEGGNPAARDGLVPAFRPTCGTADGRRWTRRVDACLARFDAGSLAVLLAAAADSPGGGHRLPSLTVPWLRCLARPPGGAVIAAPAHLPRPLSAARDAAPQLSVLEDFRPVDPRLPVRFRPRLSRPPPAASRGPPAWPYDLAGGLGGRSGPGGKVTGGRAGIYIHEEGHHRENKYT
jgi:hypothetical protein